MIGAKKLNFFSFEILAEENTYFDFLIMFTLQ